MDAYGNEGDAPFIHLLSKYLSPSYAPITGQHLMGYPVACAHGGHDLVQETNNKCTNRHNFKSPMGVRAVKKIKQTTE